MKYQILLKATHDEAVGSLTILLSQEINKDLDPYMHLINEALLLSFAEEAIQQNKGEIGMFVTVC